MPRLPLAPALGAALLLAAAALHTGCTPAPLVETESSSTAVVAAPAWVNDTPAELVRDYVTPDRFIDEEITVWRPVMSEKFGPLAKSAATRRDAILAIAENAEKLCGVKYSTERRVANQSVLESLESGKASCTGLSILLAAAYRSVGIPARIAGTARWGDRPGNHTWVEVWDTDGWHTIEYYPDKKGLNHGWIYEPIANLNEADPLSRVIAVSPAGDTYFPLPWYLPNQSVRGVDRTADYQRRAKELGHSKSTPGLADDRGILVFMAHDATGRRVALDFTVKKGDETIFSGRTPSEIDDMNNAPRRNLSALSEYKVLYRDAAGDDRVIRVTPPSGQTTDLILEYSR